MSRAANPAAANPVVNPAAASRVVSPEVAMVRTGRVAVSLVAEAVLAEPGPAKAAGPELATVRALGLGPATTAATTALTVMLPATAISRRRAARKAISPQRQPARQPATRSAQSCPLR